MLLQWLDHPALAVGAKQIRGAVGAVLDDPANRTPDMGGCLTTRELTDKIIQRLGSMP
jgi:isocitrate/isopropylmalate dehydrogenase